MKNKDKKFYKIDPSTNKVVAVYNRMPEIPGYTPNLYRVLNNQTDTYVDGYVYRRAQDVVLDENNGNVVLQDKLQSKTKENTRYKKYRSVIDVLKQYSNESAYSVYKRLRMMGVDISEPTVRTLKKEYVGEK